MKLSDNTLLVLKNFAVINQGVSIAANDSVFTKSVARSIFAKCRFDEDFPEEFSIYNLTTFLQVYSLFTDPELTFKEDHVLMSGGNIIIKYFYSNKSVVKHPTVFEIDELAERSKDLTLDFHLTSENLNSILKAASIMKYDVLHFVSENGKAIAKLSSSDVENSSKHVFNVHLGDANSEFNEVRMLIENIRFIPTTYDAFVSDSFVMLKNDTLNLTYWIVKEE